MFRTQLTHTYRGLADPINQQKPEAEVTIRASARARSCAKLSFRTVVVRFFSWSVWGSLRVCGWEEPLLLLLPCCWSQRCSHSNTWGGAEWARHIPACTAAATRWLRHQNSVVTPRECAKILPWSCRGKSFILWSYSCEKSAFSCTECVLVLSKPR